MDITTIPTTELRQDKRDAKSSILICQAALRMGITHHRDGLPVQTRIDTERRIIGKIQAELGRREGLIHASIVGQTEAVS